MAPSVKSAAKGRLVVLDGTTATRHPEMMQNAPTDDMLMAAYAAGDLAAAAPLAQRHAPRVLAVAVRMLGDLAEAEDITQEALLRLWQVAPKWEAGRAKVSTWLYRVASNLCTDRLRRRRETSLENVAEPAGQGSALTDMQDGQRRDALQAALTELPDRQRMAVILRHIEELPNPQIAEAMEISIEAVESLTARGRATLTRLLTPAREALGYQDE